jgi:hypothetical protein
MRTCWLSSVFAATLLTLAGCGEGASTPDPGPSEIEGKWLYLGPSDGPHTLTITRASMAYADIGGQWSSNWIVKRYDNDLHHFQVSFDTGTGSYLPTGQSMSGTYDVGATLLTIQLASGSSYPELRGPGTCTAAAGGTPEPECRLYVKQ